MVAAAMAGLSFATFSIYAMGLFMEPLSREFGWTRQQISAGLSTTALFAVPLSPLVGALIDKWGSRRLAIPGIIMVACAYAALSLASGSLTQWFGLWVVYGCVALAIKTTVWTAAVSSVFNASRGLALAVALCGAALAQTIAPLLAQWLIDGYGWRSAFFWMGFGWGGVVLVLVLLFFFDARDVGRRAAASAGIAAVRPILTGLTLREGVRNQQLLRIAGALLIATFLGVAMTVHKVPILTEGGITRHTAAQIAASAGVAGILGKLLSGWLLDRWQNSWISGITLGLPAAAFVMLLEPVRTPTLTVIAMLIFGFSAGAYLQVCTYLTTRYGGMRNFGKIFGCMASLMALGSALGPPVAGRIYDQYGSYSPFLIAGIPAALFCGLLVTGLGRYPDWSSRGDVAGN
jgi:MFS family permease